GPPMRSSVCTKSSSDGSRRRRCCHQLRQPRCCFGRCSLPARSTCERLTVGGRLPKHPSVSQLTSQPDSVLSKCRRSRHPIPTQIATAPITLLKYPFHRSARGSVLRKMPSGLEQWTFITTGQGHQPAHTHICGGPLKRGRTPSD